MPSVDLVERVGVQGLLCHVDNVAWVDRQQVLVVDVPTRRLINILDKTLLADVMENFKVEIRFTELGKFKPFLVGVPVVERNRVEQV